MWDRLDSASMGTGLSELLALFVFIFGVFLLLVAIAVAIRCEIPSTELPSHNPRSGVPAIRQPDLHSRERQAALRANVETVVPVYCQHYESCHAADLGGVPQLVRYQGQPAPTPPLLGEGFVDGWVGLTLGDLHQRIRISMPQRSPGSLSRQTVSDILAFMLQQNGYPAGQTDLSVEARDLATIAILKAKP
jgi:hypothetical protein